MNLWLLQERVKITLDHFFFALPLLSAISIRLITLVFGIISEGDQELSLGASSCA